MLPILKEYSIRPIWRGDNLTGFSRDLGRLFDNLWPDGSRYGPGFGSVDLYEDENHFNVEVELPGLKREQVEVTLEDNVLHMQAECLQDKDDKGSNYYVRERRTGKWSRSIHLPGTVACDKVEATFTDGVLKIALEKPPESKTRKIDVK